MARRAIELARAGRGQRERSDPRQRATSATTWSTTGWPSWSGRPATGPRSARRSTAGSGATRTWCSSAASLADHARRPRARCCWLGGSEARAAWLAVMLLGLIPANDIAVNVVNQLVTAFLPPRILPKLDLHEHGVPPEFRTAVVIPTLFGSVEAVREALENLEVQFLANREAHLHFAVLSDFTDSPTETRRGRRRDRRGRGRGRAGAQRPLRRRPARTRSTSSTAPAAGTRTRASGWDGSGSGASWPSSTGSCWARRDGRVLGDRGRRRADPRACATSSPSTPTPCSRPTRRRCWSARWPTRSTARCTTRSCGRVVRGYGILQPRVGVSLPSAHRSLFAAIHSGHPGRGSLHHRRLRRLPGPLRRGELHRQGDLRRRRVRAGDPRPLPREHAALARPDRGELRPRRPRHRRDRLRRLPHPLPDLHPAQAPLDPGRLAAAALAHARGCRAPTAPSPTGSRCSRAGRSSTTCAAARSSWPSCVFLVAGWLLLPGSPLRWTLLGLGAIAAPWIVSLLLAVLRPPLDKSWRAYYAAVGRDAATSMQQVALAIVFLPHQAWVSADAIVRTLWRMLVLAAAPARVADRVADRARHVRLVPHRLAQHVARGGARGRHRWPRWSGARWPSPTRGARPGSSRSRCCR